MGYKNRILDLNDTIKAFYKDEQRNHVEEYITVKKLLMETREGFHCFGWYIHKTQSTAFTDEVMELAEKEILGAAKGAQQLDSYRKAVDFAKKTNLEKRNRIIKEQQEATDRQVNNDSDGLEDGSYRPSYSKYGGAYGYDDDTIDTAFEGDPENYWNID